MTKTEFTEKEAELMNKITSYMQENGMTLEQLDDVCTEVRKVFYRNAVMKG